LVTFKNINYCVRGGHNSRTHYSASVARVWRYRNLIITIITITNLRAGRGQHRPCRILARCRKTPYPARL